MNAKAFRQALNTFDMRQTEFADLFDISTRTVTNYATIGVPVGPPTILIALMLLGTVGKEDIEKAKSRSRRSSLGHHSPGD